MSGSAIAKRKTHLLKMLGTKANYRSDTKIPLADISSEIVLQQFVGGTRCADRSNPSFEGSGDLSYDINALMADGFVRPAYLHEKRNTVGEVVYDGDALKMTPKGLTELRELGRSWLSKAIEKQPMTFVHILFTSLNVVWTILLGWSTWYRAG